MFRAFFSLGRIPDPRSILSTWLAVALSFVCFLVDRSAAQDAAANTNVLMQLYVQAKSSFQNKEWGEAAKSFELLAEKVPGTQLGCESSYYAMLAHVRQGSDHSDAVIQAWLDSTSKLQVTRLDSNFQKSLAGWVLNARLLQAQRDRAAGRYQQAESRLRDIVNVAEDLKSGVQTEKKNPSNLAIVWLELGNVLVDLKREPGETTACFEKAVAIIEEEASAVEGLHPIHEQALIGMAQSALGASDWTGLLDRVQPIIQRSHDPAAIVKCKLLQLRAYQNLGHQDWISELLESAAEISRTATLPPALLRELALAMDSVGQREKAQLIWSQIASQYPESPECIEALVQRGRFAWMDEDWNQTRELATGAIERSRDREFGKSTEYKAFAYFLRGGALRRLGDIDDSIHDLKQALNLVSTIPSLEPSIRYELSESFYLKQAWQEAQEQWVWFQPRASSATGESHESDASPSVNDSKGVETAWPPQWMSTMMLRRAEMHAIRKEWEETESIVYQIRTQFPECPKRREVDYLLARCWIYKAKFADARELLESVASNPPGKPDVFVWRSWWMIGETYLMQRNYESAILAYTNVLDTEPNAYWRSAARVQLGQCFELTRNPNKARAIYEQVLAEDANGPFVATVRERLIGLPEETNTPRRTGESRSGNRR